MEYIWLILGIVIGLVVFVLFLVLAYKIGKLTERQRVVAVVEQYKKALMQRSKLDKLSDFTKGEFARLADIFGDLGNLIRGKR